MTKSEEKYKIAYNKVNKKCRLHINKITWDSSSQ